jgi:maintenance of morphology protein 1
LRHKHSRSIIKKGEESRGGPSIATILAKTYYNVKGHQPESLDWFNVLIAQTIAQLRADARQDGAVLTSLTEVLNAGSKPDWIGEIRVTEIALGDEFPIFSNCRVMPAEDGFWYGPGSHGDQEGRLQARMDVDLSDVITIGVETTLNLNWPKPFSAVLPVALAVSIVRFSGTLAMSFIPSSSPPSTTVNTPSSASNSHPPDTQTHTDPNRPSTSSSNPSNPTPHRPTTLAFTFLDDYRLDLSIRSLVGSRSRLQDVPKIAQLIESRVHAWFDERAVEPRFQQIVLPSLWPRKHNTRGGATEEAEDEGIDVGDPLDDEAVPAAGLEASGLGGGSSFIPPASSAAATLEERIEAEGAKLREAEVLAGERKATRRDDGMRWRGERDREREQIGRGETTRPRPINRFSSEQTYSGQKGMPGAMLE